VRHLAKMRALSFHISCTQTLAQRALEAESGYHQASITFYLILILHLALRF
jgi:hypothetical protein